MDNLPTRRVPLPLLVLTTLIVTSCGQQTVRQFGQDQHGEDGTDQSDDMRPQYRDLLSDQDQTPHDLHGESDERETLETNDFGQLADSVADVID
ncbi:MAG: hypothetical protein KC561_21695, partial [Myxococcales bacterium]|nr:hypothetical protein [Myxococcales bacterium]